MRLSFPEAEVTRSLSRNLIIKQMYTVVDNDDKRVIDTNTLMQKRMDELAEKMRQPDNEGFSAGLDAQEVEQLLDGGEAADTNVIKAARENASQLLEQAKREAEQIVADAHAESIQLLQAASADAEKEKGRLLEQAKKQGYDEGWKAAEKEAAASRQQYADKERELEQYYEQQLQEMEPQLVDTITGIYEHIFNVELSSDRDILNHLISTTLRKLENGHEFIIHVSKEDYPYVNMQKKQLLAGTVAGNCNVDIVEDVTLSHNDCMIETDGGIFDCGLGTQLSELKQKLTLLSWSKEE